MPSGRLQRFVFLIRVAVVLMIGAIWIAAVVEIGREDRDTLARAERDSGNVALITAEQGQRTIALIDQGLHLLGREIQRETVRPAELAEMAADLFPPDIVVQISYADETGRVRGSNLQGFRNDPALPAVSIADREHFLFHRDHPDAGLYISRAVFGRVSKRWTIQFTRRLSKPDGGFGGIIVASVDPMVLSRSLAGQDVGKDGIVGLIGLDGFIRARSTLTDAMLAGGTEHSPLLDAARLTDHGFFHGTSTIDGVDRLESWRRLRGYPLVIATGFSAPVFMAEARRREGAIIMVASAFSLALAAMAVLVVRYSRREAQTSA
jgi:hypothetical protein